MVKPLVKPLVVHCKVSPYDVYIGRGSKWGNPFKIGPDGDRDAVITKYAEWLFEQPQLLQEAASLKGKVLGCWCAPKACHGDVLAEIANPWTDVELADGTWKDSGDVVAVIDLRSDVANWMSETIIGRWEVGGGVYGEDNAGNFFYRPPRISFENEDEALLFTLTWGMRIPDEPHLIE